MTTRDRTVLIAVLLIGLLAGAWMLVVSPERQKASTLDTQVAAAKAQLSAAEGELANARAAQTQVHDRVQLARGPGQSGSGRQRSPRPDLPAVGCLPAEERRLLLDRRKQRLGRSLELDPQLRACLEQRLRVERGDPAALTQMPFTFIFNGGFFDLERLFSSLDAAVQRTPTRALRVSGRLLTIQSVKLAPAAGSTPEPGKPANTSLTGTITATAYVLPAGQGLANAPAPSTGTSPASSTTGASGSPTAPAIVRVGP